jgi:hypothetical protein
MTLGQKMKRGEKYCEGGKEVRISEGKLQRGRKCVIHGYQLVVLYSRQNN